MKNKNFLKKTGKKHNGNNNNKIDNKTNESEWNGNSMYFEGLCVSPSPSSSCLAHEWILDFGWTFYMSQNRDWFSEFIH